MQLFCIESESDSYSVVSDSLWHFGQQPTKLLYLWDFSGKNTGVRCHFLLNGDIPNPEVEPESPVSPSFQVDSLPTEPTQEIRNVTLSLGTEMRKRWFQKMS